MAENLNASAQSLNDATFDGDNELGSGNGMQEGYRAPMTVLRRHWALRQENASFSDMSESDVNETVSDTA